MMDSRRRLLKYEAIVAKKIEERSSISTEVVKKEEWVKMLHQMPDIRLEKIASALTSDANLHPERCWEQNQLAQV